jgi:anti-sigma factor RsiW
MISCRSVRKYFSSYLDGSLRGTEMQQVGGHLASCRECADEFAEWRQMQDALYELGPAKAPADLALRLRVAISRERTRTPKNMLDQLRVRWENAIQPYLLQASAGLVSSILLIGTVAMLIGAFAAPEQAVAGDSPIGSATAPHFLYTSTAGTSVLLSQGEPVVVEAYVNGQGEVYDYHIVAGPKDPQTRAAIENLLLFSVFRPATLYGQPVRGVALISFSGVAVHG